MQNGNSGTIIRTIALPASATSSVDLRLVITPNPQPNGNDRPPQVDMYYAINGGTSFTKLNTSTVTLPTNWLSAAGKAGIMTAHQGTGGAQFTAAYDSFAVERYYS